MYKSMAAAPHAREVRALPAQYELLHNEGRGGVSSFSGNFASLFTFSTFSSLLEPMHIIPPPTVSIVIDRRVLVRPGVGQR